MALKPAQESEVEGLIFLQIPLVVNETDSKSGVLLWFLLELPLILLQPFLKAIF